MGQGSAHFPSSTGGPFSAEPRAATSQSRHTDQGRGRYCPQADARTPARNHPSPTSSHSNPPTVNLSTRSSISRSDARSWRRVSPSSSDRRSILSSIFRWIAWTRLLSASSSSFKYLIHLSTSASSAGRTDIRASAPVVTTSPEPASRVTDRPSRPLPNRDSTRLQARRPPSRRRRKIRGLPVTLATFPSTASTASTNPRTSRMLPEVRHASASDAWRRKPAAMAAASPRKNVVTCRTLVSPSPAPSLVMTLHGTAIRRATTATGAQAPCRWGPPENGPEFVFPSDARPPVPPLSRWIFNPVCVPEPAESCHVRRGCVVIVTYIPLPGGP